MIGFSLWSFDCHVWAITRPMKVMKPVLARKVKPINRDTPMSPIPRKLVRLCTVTPCSIPRNWCNCAVLHFVTHKCPFSHPTHLISLISFLFPLSLLRCNASTFLYSMLILMFSFFLFDRYGIEQEYTLIQKNVNWHLG